MTVCCISDLHSQLPEWRHPSGDVVIFAGDFTGPRSYHLQVPATEQFLKWFADLPFAHKLLVAGNHDGVPCLQPALFKDMLAAYPSVTYLEDSAVTINNHVFYGSPHTPKFMDWYFMKSESQLDRLYKSVPLDTSVLITHGPPYGILDWTIYAGSHVGSHALLRLTKRLPDLKLHVFGHIHESYGIVTDTHVSANVSQLNDRYALTNPPIYLTLEGNQCNLLVI